MNESLSGKDIMNMLGSECKILRYSNLKNINSLDDFMKMYRYVIVLYEWKKDYGHWTALIKLQDGSNRIEFFDSYGTKPDLMLKKLPIRIRNNFGMDLPEILRLLTTSNHKIEYSPYKLQSTNPNIRTCGKWCVIRCLFDHLNNDNFYLLFKNRKNKDKLVSKLYKQIKLKFVDK